ncbi:DUF5994 family protein [Actinoplanes solisilvae]|uniref:DUF5994 family protein n=1 Tax=Actinoplanes solisilvae TaxID=2486853 RepID=UPI000FDA69E1|nr:DUF5994 family protein [Actinoplanes solisilvae]
MTSLEYRTDPPTALDPPRVGLEKVAEHHLLLDGCWWPSSDDLGAQLRALVPVLDQVRGPVGRLLLSAAGWATRPHQVVLDDRTVSLGYLADQPPSMMTVRCVDGGTFFMRVAPSGPAPDQG